MRTSNNAGSVWAFLAITSLAIAIPSCGDDEDDGNGGGDGGSSGKGGSSGASGSSGQGGTAGQGGSSGQGGTAGRGGTAGQGGSAGSGGTAGQGGTAGSGGTGALGGEGGNMGGEGGQGEPEPVLLYDFETADQVGGSGWNHIYGGVSATQSTDQHFDGASSLKFTYGALDNANTMIGVSGASRNGVEFWPGTVLTFHAWLPADWDTTGGTYFQAIGQANNFAIFDSTGNSARTAVPGGWTTWTYTIPETFPGGFQTLAFQIGDNSGGATIAAGSVYIDAITATPSEDPGCDRATPSVTHDFETAWPALPTEQPYQVADGTDAVTGPNVTIARSTTQFFGTGAASLGVAFSALPPPAAPETGKRIVFINKPNVYCGQTMTFHVFLPAGSDGLNFQPFVQYNGYSQFVGTGPQGTVTRDGWNTVTLAVPANVGPGGIQRVGIEFIYTGTAPYTGEVFIDQVTWGT